MSVLMGLVLILWPLVVWADGCTQITVSTPQGMTCCQQCCYGGHCQVTCL